MDYKVKDNMMVSTDSEFDYELNMFYACFDDGDCGIINDERVINITEHNVCAALNWVNFWKAVGPEGRSRFCQVCLPATSTSLWHSPSSPHASNNP